MEENKIKEDLRKFIIHNYLKNHDETLKDTDSFLELGIVDSIGVIELTHFIQEHYSIKIMVPEIIPENIDTLNNLGKFITKKLKSK